MKKAIFSTLGAVAIGLASNDAWAGSIARLTYDGIAGTAVSALTNSAAFPDQPTFREQFDDFLPSVGGKPLFGFQSKENNGNNFGSYTRGYLEAPATGSYVFYIASDDSSELRLSADHTEANRRRIAFESGSGAALFGGDRLSERRSAPIALVRGQKYFLEAIHKQGAGASYLQVGWQRPDGVQEIIPALHLAQHPLDPFIGRADPNLPPTFNDAGLNGGDLPAAVATSEGGDVLLQLDVIAAQPTAIVWKENGEIIPGENLSFLRLKRASLARNGHTFQAFVANAFGEISTAVATVAVAPDTQKPAIASVEHLDNPNQLRVTFSEAIAVPTAANFQLKSAGGASLGINSVTLTNGETVAILSGAFAFQPGAEYSLSVTGLRDLASTPNLLDPNPTVRTFVFNPDLTPPGITSIHGVVGNTGEIQITFNERLDAASAVDVAHYSAGNLTVTSAALRADGKTVTLKTSAQASGEIYLLSVRGVKDIAVAGNVLNTLASFKSELTYASEILADAPVRYWHFNEIVGPLASTAAAIDPLATGNIPLASGVSLGAPSLVPSLQQDGALAFDGSGAVIVPNGSDLNAVAGPWAKRTVEFWFKANTVPAPGTTGLAATAGLWEQGAATRSIAAYLWRDPANENPDEALLTFHAFNSTADGPGSPWGLTGAPAIFAQTPVHAGETYHVAGVFDGDATGVTGSLILYVNGAEVARVGGVGQIYNHTGDIQIGRGNGVIHTGENGNLGVLDGVIDEISYFNKALAPTRVVAHYQAGLGATNSGGDTLDIARIETRGNPNQALVTFNRPLVANAASNVANFSLKTVSGAALTIDSATLLPGDFTVRLAGAFNLQLGSAYTVAASNLAAEPIVKTFVFNETGAAGVGPGSDLTDRSVAENSSTTFTIVPTGIGPFTYQWFRNGDLIEGATQAALAVVATPGTAGDYTARIANEINSIVTSPTHLTVLLDTTAPTVSGVRGLAGSLHEVRIAVSEPLDAGSATNTAYYNLGSVSILSASLGSAGTNVTLKTSGLVAGQSYLLKITGVKDRASAGNFLAASASFIAVESYPDEILAEAPVRYWRFDETAGTIAPSLAYVFDTAASATATFINAPQLQAASLVPSLPAATSVRLRAAATNSITVPNGSDLNAVRGPWAKRTIDFFFKAETLPTPGTTGLASTAGLYEEGGANRGLAIYLWRDPANANANEAELVFHAVNNLADGAGSPFGLPGGQAAFVQHTVTAGQTYHVTAVFDGDSAGLNGSLILYLDGAEAARATGVGQLYNHTSDIQIGRGNALTHLNLSGVLGAFDGEIDEFSIFNQALAPVRIAELQRIASNAPTTAIAFKSARLESGRPVFEWEGAAQLEGSAVVNGPYETIDGAASPYTAADSPWRFFRLRK